MSTEDVKCFLRAAGKATLWAMLVAYACAAVAVLGAQRPWGMFWVMVDAYAAGTMLIVTYDETTSVRVVVSIVVSAASVMFAEAFGWPYAAAAARWAADTAVVQWLSNHVLLAACVSVFVSVWGVAFLVYVAKCRDERARTNTGGIQE